MMRDTKAVDSESGFLPVSGMEDGVVDGGENVQYLFPGVQVVEVKELHVTNPQQRKDCDASSSFSSMGSDGSADFNAKLEECQERAAWGGKLEFMLTMIGYAVGLGNVWRFPYLCYKNGGGAFLLPYCIMLAVVGLPLFYMELALGQYASLGPITIWRLNPLMKGLGYSMVIVSWLIGLYYNVVIAHVLYYLYSSFTSVLPWTTCDNDWNTKHCLIPTDSQYMKNETINATLENTTTSSPQLNFTRTPSEEYYRFNVLSQNDSIDEFGTIQWHLALSLFIAWLLVFLVLMKGIKSLGKVVYFTAIFPYIMLTVLFIRGVTLPGAGTGIAYYLKPDFERLLDPRVWSDAATQIFYSLSACSGGLIAMASYNNFNNNCYRDSLIVCFINCGTSIFAGLVIFSVLGFMALEKGVGIEDVADDGPGLAFVVYPEALSRMPVSPMWAVFFFIMMATLGFGSEFSIIECVLSAIGDEFPILRKERKYNIAFRAIFCTVAFLLGLPMICNGGIFLLNLVDYSVGGFPLLVVGLVELITINWVYGYSKFADNISMMLGHQPGKYWYICWRYGSALVIAITIIMNIAMYKEPDLDDVLYPEWAKSLGWLIAMFPIVVIPAWFLYKYCRIGGFELMKDGMKPLPTWGPISKSKQRQYADVETNEDKRLPNPAFARLMGSNMSNATTVTECSPASSTLNLIRSKNLSESDF